MIFDTNPGVKQMNRYISILIPVLVFSLWSCRKIEKLPPEPMVEFREFAVFDTVDILGNKAKAGKLSFYFEDGDGDIGLPQPDTTGYSSSSSNLFLNLFRKTGGEFVLAGPIDPLYPSEYRIPYLETPGQNKILRGTIDVTLIYFFYNPHDTLYYDFWIRDRSGHDSNTATTCIIVLGENGRCLAE